MKIISNHSIFRNFSANDWNHPEPKNLLAQTLVCYGSKASTFSSNAEKMRKSAISEDQIALTSNSQNH
jgi:hypothetical protein